VNNKLEIWRDTLETRSLKLGRLKTNICKFIKNRSIDAAMVRREDHIIPNMD